MMKGLPPETIFITRKSRYEGYLPEEMKAEYEIIARGKMGHKKCVAFRRKSASAETKQ